MEQEFSRALRNLPLEIEIHLAHSFFPWETTEEDNQTCWAKGDVLYNDERLQGPALLSLVSAAQPSGNDNTEALKELLLSFNGSFAFVILTGDGILCAVDRVRSIPLFYATTDTHLIISDDAQYLRDQINPVFDERSGAEFLVTGYVTGSATLYEGIHQLQAGEYLKYVPRDDRLTTSFYDRFWHEKYYSDSEEALLDRLDTVFVRVYERFISSIRDQGSQIVVPLSGGLDSRIIVSMLKRCGVDDVICFSYGRKGSREARISQQVAETLGYQWHFVEYSKGNCNFPSEKMKGYQDYGGDLVSLPHLQDLLAVRILIETGKVPENATFIPGHSGMVAGYHIPLRADQPQDFSDTTFIQHILQTHYRLWDWNDDPQLYELFREKIKSTIADTTIHDEESWINAIELWDCRERQAKFIVNSVRVYEFFGCSWRIPLWDNDVIDFFEKIPVKYRKNGYLYRKYASEKLFVNALREMGRIDCTTPLSDAPQPYRLLKGIVHVTRAKADSFTNIFWFNTECGLIWALTGQNLSLLRLKTRVFGNGYDLLPGHESMNNVLRHSQNSRVLPLSNGFGTYVYLSGITGEENYRRQIPP